TGSFYRGPSRTVIVVRFPVPRRAVPPPRLPPRAVWTCDAAGRADRADVYVPRELANAAAGSGPSGRRRRAVLPARQALREAEVRDPGRERGRGARGGGRGDRAGAP